MDSIHLCMNCLASASVSDAILSDRDDFATLEDHCNVIVGVVFRRVTSHLGQDICIYMPCQPCREVCHPTLPLLGAATFTFITLRF
jgi:hypothetical protein